MARRKPAARRSGRAPLQFQPISFDVNTPAHRIGGRAERLEGRRLMSVATWDGGSMTDSDWSTPENWVGDVAPTANDDLVFDSAGLRPATNNDFPNGTSFNSITVESRGPGEDQYDLGGNAITLADGISFDISDVTASSAGGGIGLPIALSGAQTFVTIGAAESGSGLALDDVDTDGHELTIQAADVNARINVTGVVSGSGNVRVTGAGDVYFYADNTYSGGTAVTAGDLFVVDLLETGNRQTGSGAVTISAGASLRGRGRVEDVTVNGTIAPGTDGSATVLETGDLALGSGATQAMNLASFSSTGDRIEVTGTVNLGGAALAVTTGTGFALSPGQSVTLIDNDGSDPVSGTYADIPNGGRLTGLTTSYRLFYNGGDGNDVVLTNVGTTRTWDGGGNDNNWTNSANWAGDVPPVAGDAMVFPAGVSDKSTTNDFTNGTAFQSITIEDDGYTLAGNQMALASGLTYAAGSGTTGPSTVSMPIVLNGSQTFRVTGTASNATLGITGAITSADGHDLTVTFDPVESSSNIDVAGVISVNSAVSKTGDGGLSLLATNTYSGNTVVADGAGALYVNNGSVASQTGAGTTTIGVNAELRGNGRGGNVTVKGSLLPGASTGTIGTLRTGNLSFTSAGTYGVAVDTDSSFDAVEVAGTVSLGTADLALAVGQDFSLGENESITIIANDGIDDVTGTFAGIANGGTIPGLPSQYRLFYDGGDGNDVAIVHFVPPPAGLIGFADSAVTVSEADGQVTLTVNRIGGSTGSVTADYAITSGTATNGSDFSALAGTLTFADGETTKTIVVPILDDAAIEGSETFTVTLANFTGGAAAGNVVASVVTIADNEEAVSIAFAESSYTVNESQGVLTVTVLRLGGNTGTVTANYRTFVPERLQPASSTTDFSGASGTITFGPGETSKTFEVAILNDAKHEGSESFDLILDQPTGGATIGESGSASITVEVVDDDPNAAPVAVNDIATGMPGQPVTIDVAANDTDADDDSLTVAIASQPANGVVQLVDGGIAYTAAAGFSGTDTLTYTVTDTAGGSATGTVTIVTAGTTLLTDPTDPTKTVLVTGGTTSADKINFAVKKGGQVQVTVNGKSQGLFNPTGRIIVGTGAGNDKIAVGKLTIPVQLDAGEGDDTLTGTRFNDVLIGGPGDDRISGGAGRDILIGGEGIDRLAGGGDDDILIGGTVTYQSDSENGRKALASLLTTWASTAEYDARVAEVVAGTGSLAGVKLAKDDTVLDDGTRDTLAGDAGRDLLFGTATNSTAPELFKGAKKDETIIS